MNHLTEEQISAWVARMGTRAEDQSQNEEQHVRKCAACREEIERALDTLSLFRASVWTWAQQSEGVAAPAEAALTPRRPAALQSWCWQYRWAAAAAAMVLLLAMIPITRNWQQEQRERELARHRADEMLLQQVNAELSRSVPASMEPLTSLVSWKENPYEEEGNHGKRKTEQNTTGRN